MLPKVDPTPSVSNAGVGVDEICDVTAIADNVFEVFLGPPLQLYSRRKFLTNNAHKDIWIGIYEATTQWLINRSH